MFYCMGETIIHCILQQLADQFKRLKTFILHKIKKFKNRERRNFNILQHCSFCSSDYKEHTTRCGLPRKRPPACRGVRNQRPVAAADRQYIAVHRSIQLQCSGGIVFFTCYIVTKEKNCYIRQSFLTILTLSTYYTPSFEGWVFSELGF